MYINKGRLTAIVLTAILTALIPTAGLSGDLSRVYASDAEVAIPEGYDLSGYEALIGEFKEELRDGGLRTEEEVREAIKEAEDKYGVDISAEEENKAVDLMNTVNSLGIDSDTLADVADDVYDKAISGQSYDSMSEAMDAVEKQLAESVKETVKENIKETVKQSFADFFRDLWEQIKEFFRGLIAKWNI